MKRNLLISNQIIIYCIIFDQRVNYLCICDEDHCHAECFGYNRSIDQCSFCLSNGLCLESKLDDRKDFLCVCPRCYHMGKDVNILMNC